MFIVDRVILHGVPPSLLALQNEGTVSEGAAACSTTRA